nr:unnamed protein product [Digitaria exilis]
MSLGLMENSLQSSPKREMIRSWLRHSRNVERRAFKGCGEMGVGRDGTVERKASRAFSGREVGGDERLRIGEAAGVGEAARGDGCVDGLKDGDRTVRIELAAEAPPCGGQRDDAGFGASCGGGERAGEGEAMGVGAAAVAEDERERRHFHWRRR